MTALGLPGAAAAQPSAPNVLQEAYAATIAQGTAHLELTETVQIGDQTVEITAQGALDFAEGDSQLTLALPEGAGELEIRSIGSTLYLKAPPEAAAALGGGDTPWISIDLAQAGMGQLGSALGGGLPTQNPGQMFGFLAGISGELQEVGTETIGGVETTHYSATVDLAALAQAQGTGGAEATAALEELLGTSTLPVDVWIDGENLIRQVKMVIPISGQGEIPGGQVSLVQTLSEFGAPVDITAPPADQVTDITAELVEQISEVPSGGVATGGGSPASSEGAPLIYGGGLLLLGAAGILAAVRRRDRGYADAA